MKAAAVQRRSGNRQAVKLKSVSLVIPAYNDETTVGKLILEADRLLKQSTPDYEIVVCNDGSSDGTLALLKRLAADNANIKLINHEVNRGFGETIKELYYAGSKELVFSLPGDFPVRAQRAFDDGSRFEQS